MTPERWREVEAMFYRALDQPPADRGAFLDAACGADTALHQEVESLLATADEAGDFLDTPASDAVLAQVADNLGSRLEQALGGDYRVERELGGGGMSRVFLAEETRLGRRVVVKVLPPALGAALDIERFRREVRLAASLRHPHIVPLLAAGESVDGLVYFTMPFIEGESLRRRIDRDGKLPPGDAVRIVRDVAEALSYAHQRAVIHRDVKPGNILVEDDHALVADFGIAKALLSAERAPGPDAGAPRRAVERPLPQESEQSLGATPSGMTLTSAGLAIGTPGYMSPEQRRCDPDIDGRSDVYSLACLTYEMLTGTKPVDPAGDATTAASAPTSSLPPAVEAVIAQARALDRDHRFTSATDFAVALERALALPDAVDGAPADPSRPRRRWVIVAAGIIVAMAASAAAIKLWRDSAKAPASTAAVPNVVSVDAGRPTIAVLPFENLGRPEDAYFADGVSDELTTRLAGIKRLRVVSRTSTRNYRATTLSLPEVGRQLGANYLLEGTVQWDRLAGGQGRVRVRPRLVRVDDDTQLWANVFDGDLTDVFALEGRIGEGVAAALDVALPGTERADLGRRPTANFEAYNAFLRAEALRATGDERTLWLQSIAWYDSAIARDPRFALALARRSEQHNDGYWSYNDRSERRADLARADAEAAVEAAPDLPEARLALGIYHYRMRRDYRRALDEFTNGLEQQPDNAELLSARGWVLRRMGLFREALQAGQQAAELDPRSWSQWWNLAATSRLVSEYASAIQYLDRATAINRQWSVPYADRARLVLLWRGDVAAASRIVQEAIPIVDVGRLMSRLRFDAPYLVPTGAAGDSVLGRFNQATFGGSRSEYTLFMANWHRARGRADLSRHYADSARVSLESELRGAPNDAGLHARLGLAHAFRGDSADARKHAARAVELLPVSADAVDGTDLLADQAMVAMLTGDTEAASEMVERVLKVNGDWSAAYFRTFPLWKRLSSRGTK